MNSADTNYSNSIYMNFTYSCNMKLNLDYLLERTWGFLALVRVYTKKRGGKLGIHVLVHKKIHNSQLLSHLCISLFPLHVEFYRPVCFTHKASIVCLF